MKCQFWQALRMLRLPTPSYTPSVYSVYSVSSASPVSPVFYLNYFLLLGPLKLRPRLKMAASYLATMPSYFLQIQAFFFTSFSPVVAEIEQIGL